MTGRPRLIVMPSRSGAAAPVEAPAPAAGLALGHRLGLGCLVAIVAVWLAVMTVVLWNRS